MFRVSLVSVCAVELRIQCRKFTSVGRRLSVVMGLEMGINLGAATEEEGWSGGVHVTLECPRDAAWKLFSDFGGLCKWKPAITVCDLVEGKDNEVGSVRYCRGTLPDSWVHEWLLVHDNENYLLKYRMEGNRFRFPEGVQGYVSQIQV